MEALQKKGHESLTVREPKCYSVALALSCPCGNPCGIQAVVLYGFELALPLPHLIDRQSSATWDETFEDTVGGMQATLASRMWGSSRSQYHVPRKCYATHVDNFSLRNSYENKFNKWIWWRLLLNAMTSK